MHEASSHEGWTVVSSLTLEEIKHTLLPHLGKRLEWENWKGQHHKAFLNQKSRKARAEMNFGGLRLEPPNLILTGALVEAQNLASLPEDA